MLTHTAVLAAKPREKDYKLSDSAGLHLLVRTNGSKLWRFRYHFMHSEKMLSLGAFPEVTIAQARTKRDEARSTLAAGMDPSRKREQDKAAAQIAGNNTFGVIAAEYIQRLADEKKSEATIIKNKWLLEDLASPLSKRPVTEITSLEVLQLLQRFEKLGRRETAHRLRGTIGSVFRLAIRTQRASNDPTTALKGALLQVEVTNRAAITDEHQLGALMVSIHEYDGWPTLRSAMLFLALTMVRPGEVRYLKKSEIDREKAIWKIPLSRMKMRRPFQVPLSRQALAIIEDSWSYTWQEDGLLFPSIRSAVKPLSENAFNSALRRMGYLQKEMTAHGFRSTASTILNERRVAHPEVIEVALAHQDENEVRRAYNRALFWPERVKLLQDWADILDKLAAKQHAR